MRIAINGVIYDSTEVPILIEFHENEEKIFNMKRFLSTPSDTTKEEKEKLINTPMKRVLYTIEREPKNDNVSCKHEHYSVCYDCWEEDVRP